MKNPTITQVSQDLNSNLRYPVVLPSTSPTACASTATVTESIADSNLTNTGAGGAITLTLPSANKMAHRGFRFYVTVAQIVNLSPISTERIWLAGSGVLNKDLIIAGTIGNYADVYSDGTHWHCVHWSGVVTKEA